MKFYSKDIRERAVATYKTQKYTQFEVAEIYGIHHKTLQNWLKTDSRGEPQIPKPKGCRPRILDSTDLQLLGDYIKNNPSATLEQMREAIGKNCSLPVISRALKELNYTNKKKQYMQVNKTEKM